MTELLSHTFSPEAVIAAVQNGADAVCIGLGGAAAANGVSNFTQEEFRKAVRYCRVRGCRVSVLLRTPVGDRETESVVTTARAAAAAGADALVVNDPGLARALRASLPDMPLYGGAQMDIHNLAAVEAAAEMGFSRVVLARELSLEQIRQIASRASIGTEVCVHGPLCVSHAGQCLFSALTSRQSANLSACPRPCLLPYSLGGRMDDRPLALKDCCLVDDIAALEEAGVSCLSLDCGAERNEVVALLTGIYSGVLHEHRSASGDEKELIEQLSLPRGTTRGYCGGSTDDLFITGREEGSAVSDKTLAAVRRAYSESELRRVPLHFYTICTKGERIRAIAFDDEGHKAFAEGPVPERAKRNGLTEAYVTDQMFKTGGTPFNCVENRAQVEEGLFLPAAVINELRRTLITRISAERAAPPRRKNMNLPLLAESKKRSSPPVRIYQVQSNEQLSDELLSLRPHYLYVPLTELSSDPAPALRFAESGTKLVAVMPRAVSDAEMPQVYEMLLPLREAGISEALTGSLGQVALLLRAGLSPRADIGMNVYNSRDLEVLRDCGFLSATLSVEMSAAQIGELRKPIDTELVAYGRLPLMLTEPCVIKQSAGRCVCSAGAQLSDNMGNLFPVVKEFGCRNVIFDTHKLYLLDNLKDPELAGLWGVRLLFTTESARECAEVARSFAGLSEYRPNQLTRGLYQRGVKRDGAKD